MKKLHIRGLRAVLLACAIAGVSVAACSSASTPSSPTDGGARTDATGSSSGGGSGSSSGGTSSGDGSGSGSDGGGCLPPAGVLDVLQDLVTGLEDSSCVGPIVDAGNYRSFCGLPCSGDTLTVMCSPETMDGSISEATVSATFTLTGTGNSSFCTGASPLDLDGGTDVFCGGSTCSDDTYTATCSTTDEDTITSNLTLTLTSNGGAGTASVTVTSGDGGVVGSCNYDVTFTRP